jgi:hypothetical protein
VIILGKNTATLCFRVHPEEVILGDNNIRYVKGFFFPAGTERRVYLKGLSIENILKYLKHAYQVTKELKN